MMSQNSHVNGQPAGELHANVEIVVEFQEVEARDRRLSHVDLEFFRLEQPVARARLPGFDESVDDALRFAEDAKIRCFIEMRTRCDGGPPTTTGFLRAWQRSIISSVSLCCGSMPPVRTRSAHSRSSSLKSSVLRLISRSDQESGSSAASVIRPSGDAGYLAPKTSAVRLKFQKVAASNRG